MLTNSKDILDNVLSVLKNDETLASYVKSFCIGSMKYSRKIFPFIEIGDFTYREGEMGAASGWLVYTIDIYAGVKNLAPGLAYQGSDSGIKGICDLCEDIIKVIAGSRFNNSIFRPVANIQNNPRYLFDKAETVCIGKITFTGEVRVTYR